MAGLRRLADMAMAKRLQAPPDPLPARALKKLDKNIRYPIKILHQQ